MPFLTEADQDQLRTIFTEQLRDSVRLRLFTQPTSKLFVPGQEMCASCEDAEPFLRELASLSDKFEVMVHNAREEQDLAREYGVEGLLPAIILEPGDDDGDGGIGRLRFLGLPAGYEFSTLVADIVDLSNRRVDLSDAAQDELKSLQQDVHLQVFVTPT